jgi:Zn-dependent protease with chaperone function
MRQTPFYRIKNICYNYTNRKYIGVVFIRRMVVIMIKLHSFLLSGLVISSHLMGASVGRSVYYQELKNLRIDPQTKVMFDEDANDALGMIQRDIITYKELSWFQRFTRSALLGLDVVVVTPETMPKLYGYVEDVCNYGHMSMPVVFITRKEGFFNALALKVFMGVGSIVIGQKLLKKLSDQELEAIVAHEIGHIKHNHSNKMLVLNAAKLAAIVSLMIYFYKEGDVSVDSIIDENGVEVPVYNFNGLLLKLYGISSVVSTIGAFVVNKRFEKEADLFACQFGKSQGIIDFFELIKQKEQERDDEFVITYDILQNNRVCLPSGKYISFIMRYYLAKIGHECGRFVKYLYHETPLGAHPSNQARIDAAKAYLAQQEA